MSVFFLAATISEFHEMLVDLMHFSFVIYLASISASMLCMSMLLCDAHKCGNIVKSVLASILMEYGGTAMGKLEQHFIQKLLQFFLFDKLVLHNSTLLAITSSDR